MNFKLFVESEEAFLNALKHNPKDEHAWLVMADFLEERGDKRGEFIRALFNRDLNTASVLWSDLMIYNDKALFPLLMKASDVVNMAHTLSDRRTTVSLSAAGKIQELMMGGRGNLETINKLLNGHGVEPIHDQGYDDEEPPIAYYVNRGDAYAPTIIFDAESRKYHLSTAADWWHTYGF
jgi:uncharacterized protein (TIGR02996 family)